MSDTPRTDKERKKPENAGRISDLISAEFARGLERENDKLFAMLEKCFWHFGEEIKRMSLNQSAASGTQLMMQQTAKLLDEIRPTTGTKPTP